jgi:uncharacterized membrane protein YvbJ
MKYCKNCGQSIEDDAKFCSSCGATIQSGEDIIFKNYNQTNQMPAKGQYETTTLVLGIVGVSLAVLNYIGIPFVHLIAIILGIIGVTLAKKDKEESGSYKKPGSYSKPGYIMSIISIVLGVLSIIIGIIIVNTYL